MLCSRSASLTRMTRMSSTIASSILRKFSACRSSLDENEIAPSLVTPSTTCATSAPNSSLIRSIGVCVSSTMSCRRPGGNRHDVELHVGELVGDLERMDQIGLPGMTDLPLVLEGRKDVRPPQQVDVGVRVVPPDLFDEVLEPDHGWRCLTSNDAEGECSRIPPPLWGVDAVVFWFTILTRFRRRQSRSCQQRRPVGTALGSILIPTFRASARRRAHAARRGSMTTRFRSTVGGRCHAGAGLSLATAGCGKYSWATLKAQKAYQGRQRHVRGPGLEGGGRTNYEDALQNNPDNLEAYFYLGNSYDNLYKPTRKGEAENDALHPEGDRATTEGRRARPRSPQMKKLALQYPRRGLRPGQAERSRQGRADRPGR